MTMTNINDIADLVQILQDNPEWRNTIRGLIVGEELGNLPKSLDTLVKTTNENFNLVHQRLERLETDVAEIKTNLAELNINVTEIKKDMSQTKGGHARTEIIRNAEAVAIEMGLEFIRTLTEADLMRMAQNASSSIPPRQIRNFTRADLVIEGKLNGEIHYAAVEISFTATQNDAERATRNANFLTQFTGWPATPAVGSVKNDPALDFRINSGRLHWRQITDRDLEPE